MPESAPSPSTTWDRGGLLTPSHPRLRPPAAAPTFVAISPDGKSVYVANGAENDVSQYDVGSGGALAQRPPPSPRRIPGRDGDQPDGKNLYVGDYTSNDVSQYDVGAAVRSPPSKSPPTSRRERRRAGSPLAPTVRASTSPTTTPESSPSTTSAPAVRSPTKSPATVASGGPGRNRAQGGRPSAYAADFGNGLSLGGVSSTAWVRRRTCPHVTCLHRCGAGPDKPRDTARSGAGRVVLRKRGRCGLAEHLQRLGLERPRRKHCAL